MKISEKKRSALRYTIAFMLIFGTVTLNERSQAIDPASQDMTFEGKDIRCVIDMNDQNFSGSALKTGLTYELLKEFSNAVGANARIETAGHKANYVDSLKQGNIDILIVPQETEISDNGVILSRSIDNSVWVLNTKNIEKVKELNTWIATYSKSDDYRKIQSKYNRMLNPFSNLDKGIISSKLSPYDSTIRKYAKTLGWDWRMLAAVIYQESKFSINTISYRGATGLMQVMPSTAKYYGVDNLLDPEQNIKAGTMHLARLQKLYNGMDDQAEKIKFVLASYNAGEGRIADCRSLAEAQNLDKNKWEEILKVIPMMREDHILENKAVKLGKFNGTETMTYIENIMNLYSAFCTICPA